MQTFFTLSSAPKKTMPCPSVIKPKAPAPKKAIASAIKKAPPAKSKFEIIALNRTFESVEEIEAWISAMPDLKDATIHRTWKKELMFCEVRTEKNK